MKNREDLIVKDRDCTIADLEVIILSQSKTLDSLRSRSADDRNLSIANEVSLRRSVRLSGMIGLVVGWSSALLWWMLSST